MGDVGVLESKVTPCEAIASTNADVIDGTGACREARNSDLS